MPANKKHHYVPRFYLKRFASTGQCIQLYNFRNARHIATANTKNQCFRDYMYGKELSFERGLAELEGSFSALLSKIEVRNTLPPALSEDHETICIMTVLQYARTAYSADAVNEYTDGFWKHVLKHDSRVSREELDRVTITQREPARFAITHFLRNYHLVMDLGCRLLVAPAGCEFITSDNPVIFYNQLMDFSSLGSETGLASKGLQIFFPLSPSQLLFMYDRHSYTVQPKRQRRIELSNKADVDQINALQAANALENVYFSSSRADIFRVVGLGARHRQSTKTQMRLFARRKPGGETSEVLSNSRPAPKTNLTLSFVSLPKPAKEWRRSFQAQRFRPATVLRDPAYVKAHDAFCEAVDAGTYQPTEFFRYLQDRSK